MLCNMVWKYFKKRVLYISGQKGEELDDLPEADIESVKDKLSVSMKGEKISTTSVLDSEESLEDDNELDLEMTLDENNKSDLIPLFINFTCTVKNKLEHSSVSVKSVTSCLCECYPNCFFHYACARAPDKKE